eukprot:4710892-Prymnesium_polylepis.1
MASCGGCFNSMARVLMADGTLRAARDLQVGDVVRTTSAEGTVAQIEATIVQQAGVKELVQIGNLRISKPHRIKVCGVWMKPEQHPSARLVRESIVLHNFITTGR